MLNKACLVDTLRYILLSLFSSIYQGLTLPGLSCFLFWHGRVGGRGPILSPLCKLYNFYRTDPKYCMLYKLSFFYTFSCKHPSVGSIGCKLWIVKIFTYFGNTIKKRIMPSKFILFIKYKKKSSAYSWCLHKCYNYHTNSHV